MYRLANAHLEIDLLDPTVDSKRLGPRYVWGGYIWQVRETSTQQPLLSGPEWPNPSPSAFNGQGLPESFRHRTRDGRDLTWSGRTGVALGAGEIEVLAEKDLAVTHPCVWRVRAGENELIFETRQKAAGLDYELVRRIELQGRTIQSFTTLTNHGAAPLSLEWFAHPFFALRDGVIEAKLEGGARVEENLGFEVRGGVFTQKRRFQGLNDGHMDFLKLPTGEKLHATIQQPERASLTFATSFAPSECVIWGNGNTFSFEPYRKIEIASGASDQWSLRYDFGVSSGISSPTFKARTPEG